MLVNMAERPYHHGDLRAVLLSGAERTLADRGPAAISLRELAREAGVSHAAPGRHFKDKGALLDALALSGFQRLKSALQEATSEGTGARTRILALARAYVDFTLANGALLDLMYSRKHDGDVPDLLITAIEELLDIVLAPILQGQHDGEIVQGDPNSIAHTVVSTLHGFASLTADHSKEKFDGALPEVVHHLLHGLAPR